MLLVSDTVGFIRDLPSQLLDAFKATLEELQYADVLLHVVDVPRKASMNASASSRTFSCPSASRKKRTSSSATRSISAKSRRSFLQAWLISRNASFPAKTGQGLAELVDLLKKIAQASDVVLEMTLPYDSAQGQRIAQAHQFGRVLAEEYDEAGAKLKVQMPLPEAKKYFREFLPQETENETKW